MARPVLLSILKDLEDKEFVEFKWYLLNGALTKNTIAKGELNNADRLKVVDLMVQKYTDSEAQKIAIKALESINQNVLADKLRGNLPEGDVPAGGGSSSAGKARPAETGGVALNIQASDGGTVKAPVVHGAVFQGTVNFS